jgi:predicted ribosome quality control (RQC) complex YloA/Tae2 family protein
MSMRWDTLLARHTAAVLGRELVGARLRAVRMDRSERDVTLLFEDRALVWRLHPRRGYLLVRPAATPTEDDHRLRGELTRVDAPPDERIVRLHFVAGKAGRFSVVVELMSTQWNAVVTEGESDLVRHLLWRPSGDTRRVTGQSYEPPPPTGRAGLSGDVPLEAWLSALEPLEPEKRRSALLRGFAWSSPLNAEALLGEPEADLAAGHRLWVETSDTRARAKPVVLELPSGPQPYPFPLAGTESRPASTLLDAFEACATSDGEGALAIALAPNLVERLERRVVHATRREQRLESELAGLADPQQLREIGDLILARYHGIPSGAVEARLTGFDGDLVDVRLEPGEPAHASAARYYQEAAKAERAAERLPAILEAARAERRGLEALLARVHTGEADADEVRGSLGPEGQRGDGDATGPSLPYRAFRSSGGLEIRVGRGARFNDDLTFHHSAPDDVWLHARHSAGAHVILRWRGPGRPPARDLEEAATLAALHSKARTSGSVPVDWTLRKHVRKPRKSPPGRVVIEREQTVFVEPDEDLLEKLS